MVKKLKLEQLAIKPKKSKINTHYFAVFSLNMKVNHPKIFI